MSLLDEQKSRDFSKYDAISTETLEEILRPPFSPEKGEAGMDIDELLYIARIVVQRDKAAGRGCDIDASWAAFKKKYLAEEGHNGKSAVRALRKHSRRALRTAAAAAVIAACFISAAYATGILSWQGLNTWPMRWGMCTS